jgi:putative addiction module component (TIGR02574 family)
MEPKVEVLEAEAMKLPAEERARLADRLIASLSEDSELEEAWAAEIEKRIADIEAGRSRLVPAADAIARARAALK